MSDFSIAQLSNNARLVLNESNLSEDAICRMTESDIKEFDNFKDRFILRHIGQINKSRSTSDHGQIPFNGGNDDSFREEHDQLSADEMSVNDSLDEESSAKESHGQQIPYCQYNIDDMLSKKDRRSKSNQAQAFFNTLLRDSAEQAHVWKKAPKLTDISEKRKNFFLTNMFKAAPQLESKKKEVWQRLGDYLQNRRKYLCDKAAGKRKLKKSKAKSSPASTCSNPESIVIINDDVNETLKPGQEELLMSKDKQKKIGKGIYIRKTCNIFSEVVIHDVYELSQCSTADLELPVSVQLPSIGEVTVFEKNIIKNLHYIQNRQNLGYEC